MVRRPTSSATTRAYLNRKSCLNLRYRLSEMPIISHISHVLHFFFRNIPAKENAALRFSLGICDRSQHFVFLIDTLCVELIDMVEIFIRQAGHCRENDFDLPRTGDIDDGFDVTSKEPEHRNAYARETNAG